MYEQKYFFFSNRSLRSYYATQGMYTSYTEEMKLKNMQNTKYEWTPADLTSSWVQYKALNKASVILFLFFLVTHIQLEWKELHHVLQYSPNYLIPA